MTPELNEDMDNYPKERYSWDRDHTIHSYALMKGCVIP